MPAAAPSPLSPRPARARSKTLATWLALLGGAFGLHRFYLHGVRDVAGWLMPWPTLAGLAGVIRMRNLGQDDHAAWLLIPLLGLMLSQAMLTAIVYGLTPDETWATRHGAGTPPRRTTWGPVLGAITALLLGGGVLMGTLAFGGQKFFEFQLQQQQQAAAPAPAAAASR